MRTASGEGAVFINDLARLTCFFLAARVAAQQHQAVSPAIEMDLECVTV